MNKDVLNLYYFRITDLWRRLCEEHQALFDITCEEYIKLLSNEVDELENLLDQKTGIISRINELEKFRQDTIDEINQTDVLDAGIKDISGLLRFMGQVEAEAENAHLFGFNKLLIDMIENIQAQNKKNQLYINKAIRSLKELRLAAIGEKNFETYNSKGSTANLKQR